METKHTKGQWVVTKTGKKKWERVFTIDSISSCDKCGITKTKSLVGEIRESAVGLEEAEANAKLISVAPEMLEAILELENDCETWCDIGEYYQSIFSRIIKKAYQ